MCYGVPDNGQLPLFKQVTVLGPPSGHIIPFGHAFPAFPVSKGRLYLCYTGSGVVGITEGRRRSDAGFVEIDGGLSIVWCRLNRRLYMEEISYHSRARFAGRPTAEIDGVKPTGGYSERGRG